MWKRRIWVFFFFLFSPSVLKNTNNNHHRIDFSTLVPSGLRKISVPSTSTSYHTRKMMCFYVLPDYTYQLLSRRK